MIGHLASFFTDIGLTAGAFVLARWLYRAYPAAWTTPNLTATAIIIVALLVFGQSYPTYMRAGQLVSNFLNPATVAFAIPLYRNRKTLIRYAPIIITGTMLGAIVGVISGIVLGVCLRLPRYVLWSLAPKSVTTPIAMGISSIVHGSPSLTAVCVMIAGNTGLLAGPYLLAKLRVNHPIARGLALGTASHGIGTAKALALYGEQDGAMGSVALALGGVVTAVVALPIVQVASRWLS